MPTYVNTIIYKIMCKDLNILECYIGHSTNIKSRKNEHKYNSNNENSKSYNIKLYTFIRANGGWDNFELIEIEKYPCNSKKEAITREHYWYFELKSTLNVISPVLDLEREKNRKEQKSQQAKENTKIKIELGKKNKLEYLKEHKDEIQEHIKMVRKEYTNKNRNKVNEYAREYNKATSERRKELAKKYYEKRKLNGYYNTASQKQKDAEYRKNNRERINEHSREYYKINSKEKNKLSKDYYENRKNKDKDNMEKTYIKLD
jgi:hypothetical protein